MSFPLYDIGATDYFITNATAWSLILPTSLKKGVPSENAASESTKKFSSDALQKQIMSTSYSFSFLHFRPEKVGTSAIR